VQENYVWIQDSSCALHELAEHKTSQDGKTVSHPWRFPSAAAHARSPFSFTSSRPAAALFTSTSIQVAAVNYTQADKPPTKKTTGGKLK
jgi:hypothetical protein